MATTLLTRPRDSRSLRREVRSWWLGALLIAVSGAWACNHAAQPSGDGAASDAGSVVDSAVLTEDAGPDAGDAGEADAGTDAGMDADAGAPDESCHNPAGAGSFDGGTLSLMAGLMGHAFNDPPAGPVFDGARFVYFGCTTAICRVPLCPGLMAIDPNQPSQLVGPALVLAGSETRQGAADGAGTAARFTSVNGLAYDGSRYLYVADRSNHNLRRIDLQEGAGFQVTTVVGVVAEPGTIDGSAASARLSEPMALAHDGHRYLYVGEWSEVSLGNGTFGYAGTIRRVDTQPGPTFATVVTVAGNPSQIGSVDGIGAAARLYGPMGLAHDGSQFLYVSAGRSIRRVDTAAGGSWGAVTTIVGGPSDGTGSVDGVGTAARFSNAAGISLDALGRLYVADSEGTVHRVDLTPGPAYGAMTTVVGVSGQQGDFIVGPLSTALLNRPQGVAAVGAGSVVVCDTYVRSLFRADGL